MKPLFAGLGVAGMLLTPVPAGALPPVAGDLDADGLSDTDEYSTWHTMLYLGDTDQDGSTDKQRSMRAPKPLDSASHPGATNDQAPQGQGQNRADSDGDGRDDGQEVFDTTDPNNPND